MKVEISQFLRDYSYPLTCLLNIDLDHWAGGGGEGVSHIKTLMIYRNGIGSKCAPDVILLNLADELYFCQEFFHTI